MLEIIIIFFQSFTVNLIYLLPILITPWGLHFNKSCVLDKYHIVKCFLRPYINLLFNYLYNKNIHYASALTSCRQLTIFNNANF